MVCGGVPQRPTGLLWQNTSPSIHHRLEIARLPGKELSAGVAGAYREPGPRVPPGVIVFDPALLRTALRRRLN